MLVKIVHPSLGPQFTRLSADVSASATSSTVENNKGFSTGDYVVFGKPGEEKTEIVLLTSTSGNTTLGHTTGPVFDHSARTQVAQIAYNQVEISRASSQTGTYSVIATIDLTLDEDYTVYEDASGTSSSWYKVRYKNSNNSTYSDYSDPVQGTGYTRASLRSMTDEILEDFGDPDAKELSRKRIRHYLNAGVRKITQELIKCFPDYRRQYTTQVLTADQATYDLPDRFLAFNRVDINFDGSDPANAYKVEIFESEAEGQPDTTYYESDPRVFFRGDQFGIRPTPDTTGGYAFLWYWDYPEEMVDEADEHGLPYGAREVLVAYGLYRAWLSKNQDKAGGYKQEYKEALEDYIEFVATSRQAYTNKKVKVTYGYDMYDD